MELFHLVQSTLLTVAFVAALWLLLVALRGRMRRSDPMWVVFVIALAIRVPLAIGVYHVLPHDWLDVDWRTYEGTAREVAQSGDLDRVLGAGYAFRAHGLTNTAVFWLIGFQPIFLRIMSAALGAFTCALLYLLLEHLSHRPRAAQFGALVVTVWPTFIAWSMTNSKEMFVAAAATGMFYCALSLSRRFRPVVAVVMVGLAVLLAIYRIYLIVLIAPVALIYVIVLWTRSAKNRQLALLTAAIATVAVMAPVLVMMRTIVFKYFNPENGLAAINVFRMAVARGGSALPIEPFGSITDLILHIPVGTAWYFLRPYPWDIGGINQTLGAVMMLVFYPFLVIAILSIPRLWNADRAFTAFIIAQTLVLAAAYGVLEGNLGSLMRHRIPTTILILGIGATYLVVRLSERLQQRASTEERTPRPSPSGDAEPIGGTTG